MKKILVGLFCICAIACFSIAEETAGDKTLAVVNGEPLMNSEFVKIASPIIEQQMQMTPVAEQTEERLNNLKNQILNQKIDQMLLIQEAKKAKIKIQKREVNDAVNQIKKRFANDADFTSELKKEGITYAQFEKRIEEQLMSMKYVEQSMKNKVQQPTEKECKAFYDNVRKQMRGEKVDAADDQKDLINNVAVLLKRMSSEQLRVRQIFIKSPKGSSAEEQKAASARVANVKKELAKNTLSFADLSEKYSEDEALRQRKGDMGIIVKGDLAKPLEDAVFKLHVGEWTKEPIKSDYGYHFFRVEERKASTSFVYDDVKKDLMEVLYQQNTKKAYDKWLESIKSKATIKINQTW
ncbi:peptidylprolyl isomerase [Candidatus Ruminimicrobium bovinum]|uniref:peptidylprolyl isomerase n=1 Tax=Candidatus Ruminimicrobium bovinum TaxID=3242779 RepID=UPI0039B89017